MGFALRSDSESVEEESASSSSSQDSLTGCCFLGAWVWAFLKEEEDLEGVGLRESFVREVSRSV